MANNSSSKLIVNLCKLNLFSDHLSLLSKGLNFCSTPHEPDSGQNRLDLYDLHRRLRLDYHLGYHFRLDLENSLLDHPNSTDRPNLFCTDPFSQKVFEWTPPSSPNLEGMILPSEQAFNNRPIMRKSKCDNLTLVERKALYDHKQQ